MFQAIAVRHNILRLKGCMRRLDVPDFSEYDETAYEEAADAMFDAAQGIADESRYILHPETSLKPCTAITTM